MWRSEGSSGLGSHLPASCGFWRLNSSQQAYMEVLFPLSQLTTQGLKAPKKVLFDSSLVWGIHFVTLTKHWRKQGKRDIFGLMVIEVQSMASGLHRLWDHLGEGEHHGKRT